MGLNKKIGVSLPLRQDDALLSNFECAFVLQPDLMKNALTDQHGK